MPSADLTSNKRQRIEELVPSSKPTAKHQAHSRILAPYRSLGHITSPTTPFSCIPRGSATFQITTSVGTTLQTYDIRHLNLVFVSSPCTPSEIRKVIAWKEFVFAAFGGLESDLAHGIWIFKRGKKVAELEEPMGGWNKSGWKDLLIFGDWVVAAFGNGEMVVWKAASKEVHTEIQSGHGGDIVAIVHPSTYLNKVVVARTSGELQIWNVKTGKLLHTCASPLPGTTTTTITNTTHLHHVAIASANGQIHIHNILTDTPLFTLGPKLSTVKRITSLSFCTDPAVGAGTTPDGKPDTSGGGRILAAGDSEGDVTLWDLEKRRIVGVLRHAHAANGFGVVKCEFLAGQKVMVTTGGDNSLKEWIFDSPHTIIPRLLRQRSGHSAPPTTLTFHNPTQSHFLISTSQDRSVWGISIRKDAQSFELSQRSAGVSRKVKKANVKEEIEDTKAPPVTAIAISDSDGAKRDWENVLTAHRGETAARTWHYEMKRLGRWVFPTTDNGEVKSVAISACGNFAFVGSSKGGIDMWNLQSGIKRGMFPPMMTVVKKKGEKNAGKRMERRAPGGHTGAVTGIVTDSTNKWIATTGLDGKLKFWDFMTGKLLHELDWSSFTAITAVRLFRESDLLAVSCDDLCIRVVDTETKKVVRELWGCGGRISDFCFSNDGRWIIAASMDSIIRIWDLPTGHLIDGMKTRSIVTALAWSGTGDFLVTGHVDDVGVNLWTNRTLFTRVPTRPMKEEDIVELGMPSTSGEGGVGILDGAFEDPASRNADENDSTMYTSKEQLSEKMVTLSLVPKARWQTLLHLDLIKQRNKPTAAPTKPKNAPFFLGALSSTKDGNINMLANPTTLADPASAAAAAAAEAEEAAALLHAEKSRIMRLQAAATGNKLTNGSESTASALLRATAAAVATKDHSSLTSLTTTTTTTSSDASNKFIEHFKTLPPALADLEIRSLDTSYWIGLSSAPVKISSAAFQDDGTEDEDGDGDEEQDELTLFIHALTSRLRSHRDWDLINAWMNVFLKIHAEVIVEICTYAVSNSVNPRKTAKVRRAEALKNALEQWKVEQKKEAKRISDLVGYCSGVVGFLRSTR